MRRFGGILKSIPKTIAIWLIRFYQIAISPILGQLQVPAHLQPVCTHRFQAVWVQEGFRAHGETAGKVSSGRTARLRSGAVMASAGGAMSDTYAL